ncbi:MAG: hypothetical protein O2887_07965 [Bacteroidetes bacterium]|nr:hypothetical protein [Bacteroidota bacterium]MDA1120414.1 hypothetical protein [Bacteroidota bacterium]
MKYSLTLFVLIICVHISDGQAFKKKQKWFQGQGKVQLLDGKVLDGLIYYSFQRSVVQVVKNEKSQGFTGDKVAYFEYFDEGFEKKRKFYSIPYDLDNNGFREDVFFEVIKELSNVALLKTQYYNNFDLVTGNFERLSEVLYFVDDKGTIKPYVEVIHKLNGESRNVIDDKALAFVTKKNYNKVQTFINNEKLNERKEEDLVTILDYFDQIR